MPRPLLTRLLLFIKEETFIFIISLTLSLRNTFLFFNKDYIPSLLKANYWYLLNMLLLSLLYIMYSL